MPPLATSMATSMATDMQPVAPPLSDWHLAYTAPEFALYRLDDDANVVLADGDTTIQAVADNIAVSEKTISATAYVLAAPATGDRPAAGAGLGILCDGTDYLADTVDATAIDSMLGANAEWAVHMLVVPRSYAAVGGPWGVLASGGVYEYVRTVGSGSGFVRLERNGAVAVLTEALQLDAPAVLSFVRSTTQLAIYVDGIVKITAADTATLPASLTGLTMFGAASNGAAVGFKSNADFYEVFGQAAAPNATEVAAIVADMRAYWAARGVVDFREVVAGAQAALYRAEDDSNAVLADTDTTVQTLVDMIPRVMKAVSDDAYVLDAPSATRRPDVAANGGMYSDGGASLFSSISGLPERIGAAGAATIYIVATGFTTGSPLTIREGANFSRALIFYGTTAAEQLRNYNNLDGDIVATGTASFTDGVLAGTVESGQVSRIYVDGTEAAAASIVQTKISDTMDTIELFDYGGNPGVVGTVYELFVCLAAHDAATVAAVTAQLKAYWTARGVSFP